MKHWFSGLYARTVTIPAVTVLERNGDLVKSLRIYVDVAPVYA